MKIKVLFSLLVLCCITTNIFAILHKVAEKPLYFFSSWIELDGDLAFIGSDEEYQINPVFLVDLSEPENPIILEELTNFLHTQNIAIKDSVAFVSCMTGLKLINYRNLDEIIISSHYSESPVNDIRIFGDIAVYSTENSFTILDVSESSAPIEISSTTTDYNIIQSQLREIHLFLLVDNGILIYDLSDTSNPQFISQFVQNMYLPDSFAFNDNWVYISYWGGLSQVDISNLDAPVLSGDNNDFLIPRNIIFQDGLLHCCDFLTGFCSYDISDFDNPLLIETYDTPREAIHYAWNEDYLYVIDWSYGLQILEKDSSENPYEVSRYFQEFSYAEDFDFDDDYIYVADMMKGLTIYDKNYPDLPIYVNGDEWGLSITLKENIVYLSYRTGTDMSVGIRSYDVSISTEPVLLNDLIADNYGTRIYNNYLIFENDSNSLKFYDLSNPGYPVFAGQITSEYSIRCYEIQNNILFLTQYDTYNHVNRIQLYDISDISNPFETSFVDMDHRISELKVFQNVIYASYYNLGWYGSNSGFSIVDFSDLENPFIVNDFNVFGAGDDRGVGFGSVYCNLFGNDLIIADNRNNRILTYDASDLLNPILQDEFYWNFSTCSIKKDGDNILVNNWVNGVTELNWGTSLILIQALLR